MQPINLQRLETGNAGTFGRLTTPTGKIYHTLELPWRDNERGLSCIPPGSYTARMAYSNHFGRKLYRLDDSQTAPRTAILIHAGNWAGDTKRGLRSDFLGCIGLGMKRGELAGQPAILNSSKAIELFYAELQGQPFLLNILPIHNGEQP